ncbi:MAG: hypothetical protein U9N54_11960 [candidate division Zixibacteria bacterium]|nr:hypothetical protein [candidate division Zixibacteria bacterium]
MKHFIFITDEGYTLLPKSESNEPDIENLQVLGFADANNAEYAFELLLKDNEYLKDNTFDKVIAMELKEKPFEAIKTFFIQK